MTNHTKLQNINSKLVKMVQRPEWLKIVECDTLSSFSCMECSLNETDNINHSIAQEKIDLSSSRLLDNVDNKLFHKSQHFKCTISSSKIEKITSYNKSMEISSPKLKKIQKNKLKILNKKTPKKNCSKDIQILNHENDENEIDKSEKFYHIHEFHKNLDQRDTNSIKDPKILDKHPEIDEEMRMILIDWLMEVCETYSLHQDTLHLAIDIIDRYMAKTHHMIYRDQYQLLGITALFIASKLEEIYPPTIQDFVYVTDSLYCMDDLRKQEKLIVQILNFFLLSSTSISKYAKFYSQLFDWAQYKCYTIDFHGTKNKYTNIPNLDDISNETNRFPSKNHKELDFSISSDTIDSLEEFSDMTKSNDLLFPLYHEDLFAETMNLINILILDINSIQYRPSVLAFCALLYASRLFNFDLNQKKKQNDSFENEKFFIINYKQIEMLNLDYIKTLAPPSNSKNLQKLLLPNSSGTIDEEQISKCFDHVKPFMQARIEIINKSYKKTNFKPHHLAWEFNSSKASHKSIGPFLPNLLQSHHNELNDFDLVLKWQKINSTQKKKVLKEINN